MSPEAGRIWRGNAELAETIAECWKRRALEFKSERDQWRWVAERRYRVPTTYVIGFCAFVLGAIGGLILSSPPFLPAHKHPFSATPHRDTPPHSDTPATSVSAASGRRP